MADLDLDEIERRSLAIAEQLARHGHCCREDRDFVAETLPALVAAARSFEALVCDQQRLLEEADDATLTERTRADAAEATIRAKDAELGDRRAQINVQQRLMSSLQCQLAVVLAQNAKLREALEDRAMSGLLCLLCDTVNGHAPSCLLSPEAGAGDGWRPISEAPKDGTVVLVYRPDAGVFTAHFVEEDAHIATAASPPEGECFWFSTSGEDLTGDLPTHFQPLPHAPKEKSEPDGCNIYDGGPYGDRQQEGEGNG